MLFFTSCFLACQPWASYQIGYHRAILSHMQDFSFAFFEVPEGSVNPFPQAVQVSLNSILVLHFLWSGICCELATSTHLNNEVFNKDIKQRWPQDQPLRDIPKLVTVYQSDFEPSSPGNYLSPFAARLSSPYLSNMTIRKLQQSMSKASLKSKWHPLLFPCPQSQTRKANNIN